MSNTTLLSQNKILIAGPDTELKKRLIEKLTASDYSVAEYQNYSSAENFTPNHLVFVYNWDSNTVCKTPLKRQFEEFVDVIQILQKPLTLVVNVDPFLEVVWKGDSPVFPQKYSYTGLNEYDSIFPVESVKKLLKLKKIKASILKVGYLYSENIASQKSVIDYFISQAKNKKNIILPGNHSEYIYPTNINDACFGIIRSIIGYKNKRNIFIFNSSQVSLNTLSKIIKDRFYRERLLTVKIGTLESLVIPLVKISSVEIDKSSNKINWSAKSSLISVIDLVSATTPNAQKRKRKKVSTGNKKYLTYLTIGFILLIISPFVFFVLNTSSAILDIQLAKNNIQEQKYSEAIQRIKISESKFNRNLILHNILSVLPIVSNKLFIFSDVNHFSLSGVYLNRSLESALEIVQGSEGIASALEGKNGPEITDIVGDMSPKISNISSNLQLSYLESQKLSGVVGSKKIKEFQTIIKEYAQITQRAEILLPLLPSLIGKPEESSDLDKKYLILNLNNNELRPGGGFIGSYSTLDFSKGKFASFQVGDIYDIDGQLKQKVAAPAPLVDNLGVDSWYLRDANWDPDFQNNYPIIKEFYKKETGQVISGLIAIDLEFIKSILNFTGPIKLDDYDETITKDNIIELGQKYSEVNFFPSSRQKKNFFSSLSRKLFEEIIGNRRYYEPKFFSVINSALDTQSMQLAFEDEKAKGALEVLGLTNQVPGDNYSADTKKTSDYFMVVDANIGANKSNAYISKKINYTLNLDKTGNLLSQAEIIYTNSSPNNSWPAGNYKNYLRVFVPRGSKLENVSVNGKDVTSQFGSFDDGKLTFFAGYLLVPFNSAKSIKFSYTQPKGLDPAAKTNEYYFYYQKQAGTYGIEFNYLFNHPDFLKVSSPDSLKYSTQAAAFTTKTQNSFSIGFQTGR